jgi:hypothetical protein
VLQVFHAAVDCEAARKRLKRPYFNAGEFGFAPELALTIDKTRTNSLKTRGGALFAWGFSATARSGGLTELGSDERDISDQD